MRALGRSIKLLTLVGLGVAGALLLTMLALLGVGLLFQHLYLAIAVVLAGGVFAGLGRWKSFNFVVDRPWLRPGTATADRRFRERRERNTVARQLRGARREEHWRD